MRLDTLEQEVKLCNKCELHKYKTNYVLGHYGKNAKIAFIVSHPNFEEDQVGKLLVGQWGQNTKKHIKEQLNLDLNDYAFLSCVKCKPMDPKKERNREPTKQSLFWCAEYLYEQLENLDIKYLVLLGYIPLFTFIKRTDFTFTGFNDSNSTKDYLGKWFTAKSILSDKTFLAYVMPSFFRGQKLNADTKHYFSLLKQGLDNNENIP